MNSQQRSNEWYDIRVGKFTASEIHKLMTSGSRKMTEEELAAEKEAKGKRTTVTTMFGDTAISYCFEKAVEVVYGKDEDNEFFSYDMQRGIELEPLAFERLRELLQYDFLDLTPAYFYPYGKDAGASPDGNINPDGVVEIKCPRRTKFFKIVRYGYDAIDKEYIAQMQMQMMCSNSTYCIFFIYGIFNGKEYWHKIRVERDEVFISELKKRIEAAIIIRDEFVQYLIENKN